jgi:glycosyltransferase involved in cell wall biosynthesis
VPVRIAYNALALTPSGTGVQTYIRELLAALVTERPANVELVARVQRDSVPLLPSGVRANAMPNLSGAGRTLASLRSLGAADLVHGLDVDVPLRAHAPTVVTVHDLTPFDVPWTMTRRKAVGERFVYRRAIRRADAIIAVSSFTAERVAAVFGRTASVVLEATPSDLTPATADAIAAARRRFDLPDTFALHVGTIEPRKDVATIAAACTRAGVTLVLAGNVPRGQTPPPGARLLGYVERDDLPALYGAATVSVTSSRYEGFGLPPLEAMACRSPVLATNSGPIPEVVGDAAVVLPAGDVDAWSAALREVVHDHARRDDLRDKGAARAAALTWPRAARETFDVYRSLGLSV